MTHANTDNRSFLADELGIEAGLDGRCTISIRGAAKLLGVSKSTVFDRISEGVRFTSAKNAEALGMDDGGGVRKNAEIDDIMFSELVTWYALETPRGKTKEAKALAAKTMSIGVRAWLQSQAGYDGKVSDLVQSVEVDRLEMEVAIDEAVLERLTEANRIRTIAQAKLKSEYDRGLEVLGNRIRDLGAEVLSLTHGLN
jgi:hypothetical protein